MAAQLGGKKRSRSQGAAAGRAVRIRQRYWKRPAAATLRKRIASTVVDDETGMVLL
uniref:Uncharacterized protein n=1 Tax=Cupriavidus taiwanensis TaxID=164546 RepID=A0A375H9F7_9BURK|nr:protein of unknown function [Cupriavidus taiwanensis]